MKYLGAILGLVLPFVAFAQISPGPVDDVQAFLRDQVIPLLIVIATIIFMVGILRYVTAGGDEEKIKAGRNMLIFGIVALAVMISMWGLVKILIDTFGVGGTPIPANLGEL